MIYRFTHAIILILAISFLGFAQVSASYVGGLLFNPGHHEMHSPPINPHSEPAGYDQPAPDDDGKSLLPWFCAGTLLGGFVCVGVRRLKDGVEAARYFGVAAATGIGLGPITVLSFASHYFPNPKWYHAMAVCGLFAALAWFLIELATWVGVGIMKAAQERGFAGIRDQIVMIITMGTVNNNPKPANANDTTSTSPPPAPPVAGAPKS